MDQMGWPYDILDCLWLYSVFVLLTLHFVRQRQTSPCGPQPDTDT